MCVCVRACVLKLVRIMYSCCCAQEPTLSPVVHYSLLLLSFLLFEGLHLTGCCYLYCMYALLNGFLQQAQQGVNLFTVPSPCMVSGERLLLRPWFDLVSASSLSVRKSTCLLCSREATSQPTRPCAGHSGWCYSSLVRSVWTHALHGVHLQVLWTQQCVAESELS